MFSGNGTVGKVTYVETKEGRAKAWLVYLRSRHRILRLDDGRYAKIVRGSTDPSTHVWTKRNRVVWRHLARFPHPGLMRVYERVTDENGDEGFLCEGLLDHQLGAGTHPSAMTLGGFLETCERIALAAGHMHAHGFVHGDITPGNVCFRPDGSPVLIDLDTSVKIGQQLRYPGENGGSCIVLTPACCSPEQAAGHAVGPASDVFCLALTALSWVSGAYGMLGSVSNDQRHLIALCREGRYPHWHAVEEHLRNPGVVDLFSRAIEPCPFDRFADGNAFADAVVCVRRRLSPDLLARPFRADAFVGADASTAGETVHTY